MTFARLLSEIVCLRDHFPYINWNWQLTSSNFVHTQNELVKSLINLNFNNVTHKIQTSNKDYAILCVLLPIYIEPTNYHNYSTSQSVSGQQPNISHLKIFLVYCICSNYTTKKKKKLRWVLKKNP